jgi:hypothetical protein
MRRLILASTLLAAAAVEGGCKNVPAVTVDVGQVTVCVEDAIIAQVQAGATTFEDIAIAIGTACGMITAQEVENIINLWTNGGGSDAGTLPLKVIRALQDPIFAAKLRALHHK